MFMSIAKLVTGDSTAVGPGENRFLQCDVLVLCSGREGKESSGIRSGLFVLTGLILLKKDSMLLFSLSNLCKSHAGVLLYDRFGLNFESEKARQSKFRANPEAKQLARNN